MLICPKTRRPIFRPPTMQKAGTFVTACFVCPHCKKMHWTEETVGEKPRKIVNPNNLRVCEELTQAEIDALPDD